jgi:putative ABC transport system permease protein
MFGRKRKPDDFSAEVESHLELEVERLKEQGMSEEEARAAARRNFGNLTCAEERFYEASRWVWLDSLRQDVRYGLRQLRRNPGFTVVAVLTLALGIGANAAIFSAVNGILLKPLPYPEPSRLVGIENGSYPKGGYAAMRDQIRTMDVAVYADGHQFNLTGVGEPVRLDATLVSANFFTVLGAQPVLGRTFSTGQDIAGQDAFVVLSYGLWQQRFASDPSIVGRVIELEGAPRQVLGVMPAGFRFPSPSTALRIPLGIDPKDAIGTWGGDYMPAIGRLKRGVSYEQATAEIRLFQSHVGKMFPWPMPDSWNAGLAVVPLGQMLAGDLRSRLWILLGAVLLVLLIALANVTNLTLARASVREREIALRTALGASRPRIVHQLIVESLVMSFVGGLLGVAFAAGALPLIRSFFPPTTPGLLNVGIDWRVLLFAAGLAIFSGIVSGVAPGAQCARLAPTESLKAGGRSMAASTSRRVRQTLVAGEIALAVLLVSGAGLLIRSLWSLAHVNPGFHVEHLLTARVTPNQSFCDDSQRCVEFYRELVNEAGALPGARGAAVVNTLPLDGRVSKRSLELEGRPNAGQDLPLVWENIVSPDYFRVMDIPTLRGRAFTDGDTAGAPPAAILSAATAERFWPGVDPVGKHIRLARTTDWCTVVGVVPDVRAYTLAQSVPGWMNGTIYLPYGPKATQETRAMPAEMTLVVRAPGDPSSMAQSIREIVLRMNGETPVSEVHSMTALIAESTSSTRSIASLFASFAGIALALGAVGIYGVISFFVSQRTREFGIRMALGAQRTDVLHGVLREGLTLALAGIVVGLVAALALTRLLGNLLYGVGASDPLTLGIVAALFVFVSLAACYIPARRATKVDPMVALRYE